MRIVGGAWRGRTLIAPSGQETRPTADRVRQALFDMLMHAEWGGRTVIEGAVVLDVFAGTGALGLEALSRGAARACFIESNHAALRALRDNVAAFRAGDRTEILPVDALSVPRVSSRSGSRGLEFCAPGDGQSWPTRTSPDMTQSPVMKQGLGTAASLVFLDPPYGQNLVPRAIAWLREAGRIAAEGLIVAEIGRDEDWTPEQRILADRRYGAARIVVFRSG